MLHRRIAIQGFEGSFHQAAARKFWGDEIEIIPCATFREVLRCGEDEGKCDAAVMAIENSIAGSILPNYNLLKHSDLVVTGEIYLEIRQDLLVLPGTTLEDIREVHSHPMAILQCLEFIDRFPHWKIVETEDTALSASRITESRSPHIAAIASRLAASIYGLDRICTDIHTMSNNYTRFLILERPGQRLASHTVNKASVYFQVKNETGGLINILQVLAARRLNLSKLQSFPIQGSNWLYGFHADVEFEDPDSFDLAWEEAHRYTTEFRLYGKYAKGC